mgnify:CR=1 FL=1
MTPANAATELSSSDPVPGDAGVNADALLLHDREILSRVDDSVARVVDGAPLLLRRARGYAPLAVRLPVPSPAALIAVGPQLKNTFTLVRGSAAYVSPHIGDLESLENIAHFRATLARYEELFRTRPEVAVRDLHPGYLSTRIAVMYRGKILEVDSEQVGQSDPAADRN